MSYVPAAGRYAKMLYRRSGKSGLKLPAISLGLWNNFGHDTPAERSRRMLFTAFDLGITHFDLANNYGPPPGSAEECFGAVMRSDFRPYRDEMVVSTKAGWQMWDGPYGDLGSRKYLIASLDQSLKRMGLDYVDIFYSHRPDPETPLEETMGALDTAVRQGKALYVGISSTRARRPPTRRISFDSSARRQSSTSRATRCSIAGQSTTSLLDRLEAEGMGSIAFSPLAQGVLTDRYLDGIPPTAAPPAAVSCGRLITEKTVERVRALQAIAKRRGQTLAQMALAWVLRDSADDLRAHRGEPA